MGPSPLARMVPARVAWFLQEMPALLIPILLMLTSAQRLQYGEVPAAWDLLHALLPKVNVVSETWFGPFNVYMTLSMKKYDQFLWSCELESTQPDSYKIQATTQDLPINRRDFSHLINVQ